MRSTCYLAFLLVFSALVSAQALPQRSIAITFDDLPFATGHPHPTPAEVKSVTHDILAALKKHHAPAVGFVNEKGVHIGEDAEREAALELWLQAGQTLGNHTYSHPSFDKLTLAEFEDDAARGETVLKKLLPKYHQQLRFFRFPFNQAGDTPEKKSGFSKWLADRHYEVATCTVENADWVFASAYEKALDKHDAATADRVRTAYLDYTNAMLEFFEKASRDVFGREFPQVMLSHANKLNADTYDAVLTLMEKRGYRFVTLADAQSDPAYKTPDNYVGPYGMVWIYRWAPALSKKVDGKSEPVVPVEELTQ